jgi:hypothetical protein
VFSNTAFLTDDNENSGRDINDGILVPPVGDGNNFLPLEDAAAVRFVERTNR